MTGGALKPSRSSSGSSPAGGAPREEHCHLLVLDSSHTHILAARPLRSWLLPHLKFRGQTRAPRELASYLVHLGVDAATPMHEALLCRGLGHDEGCGPDPAVAHRYIALEARAPHGPGTGWTGDAHGAPPAATPHQPGARESRGLLTWEPIAALLDTRSALLPVQETAVRICLARLTHALAPPATT